MSKTSKIQASSGKPDYIFKPWSYVCRDGRFEIEATSMASGKTEIVAEIKPTAGFSPEGLAEFIVGTVNALERREHIINVMIAALEICLADNLSWEAENEADIALRRAKEKPLEHSGATNTNN